MNLRRRITKFILYIIIVTLFTGTFSTITSSAGPTNQAPVFGSPSPANGTTGNYWMSQLGDVQVSWIPWNIPINDPEGNRMTWTIQCNNGQTAGGTGAYNRTIYLALPSLSYSRTYKVWVNATDPIPAGSGLWTRSWYTFTTRGTSNNPPVLQRAPSPVNSSIGNPLSLSWSIRINDLEGNLFNWSIECSNGHRNSGTDASNGTKSLALSGLAYSTSYTVWVNATDPTPDGSGLYIRRWFTFTTKANNPPVFGTPSPVNGSTGNSLGFSWRIPISDPDGNSLNWRIECSNGQSASANGASGGTKSLSLSGLAPSKTYKVWVNATDPTGSGLYTRAWFTFTTQASGSNNPPVFGTPSPGNGSSGNRLYFSWSIPITDPEGTIFSWTIQCNNGQSNSGTDTSNGTQSLFLSQLAYSTTYKVWVNATDRTGSNVNTRKWYTFTTEPIYNVSIPTPISWSPITSEAGEVRDGPLVADINKDGRMEIIRSGQNGICVYDGITGALVWKHLMTMWDAHDPIEGIDLYKDGYIDIITSNGTGTIALSGKNGSTLWYNANAPLYNKHCVVGDIGTTSGNNFISNTPDGYPEVFVCTAGDENGSVLGRITALTHDGQIFAQIPTYFPCYGGLSLGDADHNGVYELYLCERNVGYDSNVVGKGVRAFWASNLTERWNHPEMLCSSHCPTLVDTNKDGKLEIVALDQTGGNGIAVYNASDGRVIHYSSIPGLRCHSQPTIYDIDGDGDLEIIVGGGSDAWGYPLIWDLYTWSPKAWLPFQCWEPPAIADLNGNGHVEILECTITNISIFDDNFVFRESIPLDNNRSDSGWYGMSMIVAQDIDNDGKLELVLNRNTRVYAYKTNGSVPTPLATSQFNYYSELRGRYPYSSPYRQTTPFVINEYPANESTNIPYNPQLSIYVYNNQQNLMNITISTNASGTWQPLKTYLKVPGGTYTTSTSGMTTPQKYYWWSINATDSTGEKTYKSYNFQTIGAGPNLPPYTPSNPFPNNNSTDISVTAGLSWTGGDPNGDPVKYDIYFGTTNPPTKIVSNQSALLYKPNTMNYNTHYYWKIIAWDNHSTSNESPIWGFITGPKVNSPPNLPSNPSPSNGATNIPLSTTLSWTGGDPDPGDTVTYDVYFGTTSSPPKVVSNQSALSYSTGTLTYHTTYYWSIIAWDQNHIKNSGGDNGIYPTWNFTTRSSSGSGGGGGSSGGSENIKPVANMSAGEPYKGVVNSEILFDGSKSYDPDGTITKWFWVFGDNTNGTGETVQHAYSKVGTYTVTLKVTDNNGTTNTDTTTCVITQPNRPPTKPIISGPTNGTKNTMYTYTANSTDADNDTIQYTFTWGDPLSRPQISGFLPNGSIFTVSHSWTAAGRYYVNVTVTDNQTKNFSTIIVYIDAIQARGIGYLIDNNGVGTYDTFYSDISKQITTAQKKDGNYLIDSNGDGKWDYTFNATTKELTKYQPPKTPGFEIIVAIGAIALVMFWKRKRTGQ